MITTTCQRWRSHRSLYRPAGETIDWRKYEVSAIEGKGSDTIARDFVLAHHYSGSYVAALRRFGIYRGPDLVGVAVFSMPRQPQLDRIECIWSNRDVLELARFVLLDDVPGNGETGFLRRCFIPLEREGFSGILSYSDPVKRASVDGTQVFPGHVGTIYQAHNASYLGLATRRSLHLLPDGQVFSEAVQSKIRSRQRGWRYGVEKLVALGAIPPEDGADLRSWLTVWRNILCRTVRHGGNHTYLWGLGRRQRRRVPVGLAYPKVGQVV